MDRLEELLLRIKKFNADREWDQFHTPSNLAKSISIEANELLECFQWNDVDYNKDDALGELADVTNYCLQMAQIFGVDIIDIVNMVVLNDAEHTSHTSYNTGLLTMVNMTAAHDMPAHIFL